MVFGMVIDRVADVSGFHETCPGRHAHRSMCTRSRTSRRLTRRVTT
jgi:hypothetical protein